MPLELNQTFERESGPCAAIYFYYTAYANVVTGLLGFVSNLICIIVLSGSNLQKTKRSGNMFKYLLIRAVCDCVVLAGRSVTPFVNCQHCFPYTTSRGAQIATLVKEHFLKFSLLLSSMIFELLANLDRYLIIIKKFERFHSSKRSFIVISVLVIIVSHLCYVYKFFVYEPVQDIITENNSTKIEYHLAVSPNKADFNLYYGLAQSLFRDVFCVLALIILNVLIFVNMRLLLRRKQALTISSAVPRNDEASSSHDSSNNRMSRAQLNLTRLILVTSLITIFSRVPVIMKYIPIAAFNSNFCLIIAVETIYELSISVNVFVYIKFNRRFRKRFHFLVYHTLNKIGLKTKKLAYLNTIYSKSD